MSAAQDRGYNTIRDLDIPNCGPAFRGKAGDQRRECRQIRHRLACQTKATRNSRKIGAAEHRSGIGQPLGAQLMDFRAVSAVIHHNDENIELMAADRLQLLHMHQETAIAVEENHRTVGTRRRDTHREGDAVADRAELADRQEALLSP